MFQFLPLLFALLNILSPSLLVGVIGEISSSSSSLRSSPVTYSYSSFVPMPPVSQAYRDRNIVASSDPARADLIYYQDDDLIKIFSFTSNLSIGAINFTADAGRFNWTIVSPYSFLLMGTTRYSIIIWDTFTYGCIQIDPITSLWLSAWTFPSVSSTTMISGQAFDDTRNRTLLIYYTQGRRTSSIQMILFSLTNGSIIANSTFNQWSNYTSASVVTFESKSGNYFLRNSDNNLNAELNGADLSIISYPITSPNITNSRMLAVDQYKNFLFPNLTGLGVNSYNNSDYIFLNAPFDTISPWDIIQTKNSKVLLRRLDLPSLNSTLVIYSKSPPDIYFSSSSSTAGNVMANYSSSSTGNVVSRSSSSASNDSNQTNQPLSFFIVATIIFVLLFVC